MCLAGLVIFLYQIETGRILQRNSGTYTLPGGTVDKGRFVGKILQEGH